MTFPPYESFGKFLKYPVMDGNVYGIEGEELDQRIVELSNRGLPFYILIPGDPLGDVLIHPVITLGAKRYELLYAGLEDGNREASPRIWVQIRRRLVLGNGIFKRWTTQAVNIPDLHKMRGDYLDPSVIRRSVAAPFPP